MLGASMDKKKLIAEIKNAQKKRDKKAAFSFDPTIFEAFQAECKKQGVPQSRVLEKFMQQFCAGYKK